MKKQSILVGCEESQTICKVLREKGHIAYSCDIGECSGGHPEWHIQDDVLKVMLGFVKVVHAADCIYQEWDVDHECPICPYCLTDYSECYHPGPTQMDEFEYREFDGELYAKVFNWDVMIAHPPCTYLAVSGAQWYYHPEDKNLPVEKRRPHPRYPNRSKDREDAVEFFLKMANAPIEKIAIENPIGVMNTRWRKPDQIVQPYMFGDSETKTTCLWLKNLQPLTPTNVVDKGERVKFSSGKTMSKWYSNASPKTRKVLRSKTFLGIAKAMEEQWIAPIV